jgi:hypothetical protein
MTQAPDLSIIIVNWKSADFLRKCLKSIFANASGLSFEILVVDNASFDGSAELVEREFPGVRFVQSTENLGFAGANNLGVRSAKGRNLLFLNPDTEVIGTALELMSSFLDATPDAGAVGCKLLNTDGTVQTSCIQAFPSILNQVLDAELLRRRFPRSKLWGMAALFEDGGRPAQVDVISGACLMLRRSTFAAVGGFSSAYFMYSEDVELCYAVRQAGFKNYYVSEATVIHHGGGSSGTESHFVTVMQRESRWRFFLKYRRRFYAAAYRCAMGISAALRAALFAAALIFTLGQFHRAAFLPKFAKWVKVLRWVTGLEAWAKRFPERPRPIDYQKL